MEVRSLNIPDENLRIAVLEALRLPYVLLQGEEDDDLVLLLTQQSARDEIDFIIREQPHLADQVASLKAAIDEAGLLEDWDSVRELIQEFVLEDREWKFDFIICDCEQPFLHGYLVDLDGNRLFPEGPTDFSEGIAFIDCSMRWEFFDVQTGIYLLKQMVFAGLPGDEVEREDIVQTLLEKMAVVDEQAVDDPPSIFVNLPPSKYLN